jgi:hypothetical protein
MMRKSFVALFLGTLASGMVRAQEAPTYLDEFIAKVKPEKRAEFDAINKRVAALNRRNKGDTWLASESMYGEENVVTFVSLRNGFGDAQKGSDLFMGALAKPGGMAATEKAMQDFNNTLLSARNEIWRRRPELGTNVPSSAADIAAVVGKARFLYMVTVRVRPGRVLEYEDQIKMVRDARARSGAQQTWLVSQSLVGEQGTSFHITRPLGSLGDIDSAPLLAQVLGPNGYKQYQKGLAENTFSTEITIGKYLPELSNPPDEIAAVDPAFWNPKPLPAAKKAAAESTK